MLHERVKRHLRCRFYEATQVRPLRLLGELVFNGVSQVAESFMNKFHHGRRHPSHPLFPILHLANHAKPWLRSLFYVPWSGPLLERNLTTRPSRCSELSEPRTISPAFAEQPVDSLAISAFCFDLDAAFVARLLSSTLLTSRNTCLCCSMKASDPSVPLSPSLVGSALSSGIRGLRPNRRLSGDMTVGSDGSGRVRLIQYMT